MGSRGGNKRFTRRLMNAKEASILEVVSANKTLSEAADTNIQTNLDNEAVARQASDTTLQTNVDNEAVARQTADTTLQTNLNTLSGSATSERTAIRSEVVLGDSTTILRAPNGDKYSVTIDTNGTPIFKLVVETDDGDPCHTTI